MTQKEFNNLKIGDVIQEIRTGRYKGRIDQVTVRPNGERKYIMTGIDNCERLVAYNPENWKTLSTRVIFWMLFWFGPFSWWYVSKTHLIHI
jgi:hypothetical protein